MIRKYNIKKRLLMCYGKTHYSPGRYLEDALRAIGTHVETHTSVIDFSKIDSKKYSGVIFVETNKTVEVKNIHMAKMPKVFWVHHGENRLERNLNLEKRYKPDLILMSHSLHLSKHFSAKVKFFPFGMDTRIFNNNKPLQKRSYDLSFVGNRHEKFYNERNKTLTLLHNHFSNYNTSLYSNVYVSQLSSLYSNSKIVFNESHHNVHPINMRIFEGMGCGALLITDEVENQRLLNLVDGKHYIIYRSSKELIDKVGYYLTHMDEAQKIASEGRKYLLQHHTYEHRARTLVRLMSSI
ncbi:CgeB family protein [Pontibacillus yanchengensis]|uniref:Spore protein YkvP/CgeB glycosyl transferase-like domain-containing protein n=1 Tax=Pontibacillus yanchengensis Y32 TaxID=1385514 RepID=A0A0A2TT09_9BACI|nr:glycosyltransferase [Pontibacillus yanchengensis]KGP72370.1 hypothetical protein N782_11945 [Pontibacillus yanchengensis Y32]